VTRQFFETHCAKSEATIEPPSVIEQIETKAAARQHSPSEIRQLARDAELKLRLQ
jgi:hypothetical protein